MAINSQAVFDAKANKYGGAHSTRFQEAYVRSVNHVIRDFDNYGNVSGVSAVTGIEEDVGLEAKWETCFDVGVDYYLQRSGEWSVDDKRDYYREYRDQLARVQAEYFLDYESNEAFGKLGDQS